MVTDVKTGKSRALTDAERAQRYRSNLATKRALVENLGNEAQRLHNYLVKEAKRGNVVAQSYVGANAAETVKKVRLSIFKNADKDSRDVTERSTKTKTL